MEKTGIFGTLPHSMIGAIKRYLFLIFLISGFGANTAVATHLIGGYMNYEFLTKTNNDYVYKISLTIFRDVQQSEVDFDQEILLGVYLNNANLDRTMVVPVGLIFTKDVKPPGNEECEYYADKKIEMAYYEKTITLPAYTEGYHITFVRCCRNMQDNLINEDGKPFQGQTYYSFIPNPALRNSSPRFSGVPSPYMCAKDTNTFLNRAVDKDGDSLVYRYVWPFQGGEPTQGGAMPDPPVNLVLPITPVQYRTGYGFLQPFGASGMVLINANNGLTTLYATTPGSYVVGIEVAEYRNGILLSTVRLDMQILVLDCPPNIKPIAKSPKGEYFEVEAGDKLCFQTEGSNSDQLPQEVTLFATGDILTGENGVKPPLATMQTKTAINFVSSEFCWTPSCEQARDKPYIIAITARDNGCPPKQDHINIEIKVLKFIGSKEILGSDRACTGTEYPVTYRAKDPKTGSSFWWEVTGGTIVSDPRRPSIQVLWTGLSAGKIRMVEISRFGCPGDTVSKSIVLIQAPSKPNITGPDTVCLNSSNIKYSVNLNNGSSYSWRLPDGTFVTNSGASVDLNWNKLGNFDLAVVEANSDGCNSDTAKIKVNVRKPLPGIVGPKSVCPNSKDIVYRALGLKGSTYQWTVTGGIKTGGGSSDRITVDWGNAGPGTVEVVETDKFKCVSNVVKIAINKTYVLDGVDPSGDTSVCEFDANVPYTVVEANGSIYRWSVVGGNKVAGDSSSNIRITWGATGLGKVGVREWAWDAVNSRECVSPERSLNIVINPIPTARQIEGNFELCQGPGEYSYRVNGFPGSTYTWTINGSQTGILGQGTSTIQYIWDLPGKFPVTVLEMSKDSCPGVLIDTFMVVHPKPVSDLIIGSQVHCIPGHNNTQYSVDGFDQSVYHWKIVNGRFTGGMSDTIRVDWNGIGYGSVTVVEVSQYGCVGDTLTLPVYINHLDIDLEVVSVGFPDTKMHGQWKTVYDNLTGDPFVVEKRVAGSEAGWTVVSREDYLNFLETQINTDLSPFEYRISGTDLCGNQKFSEVHTNILLTGSQDEEDFSLTLGFTPYLGWLNGVNRYELYRSINSDPFLRFEQQVTFGDDILIDGNSDNFRQCYRIKAYEQDGGNKFSWSNEICFFFQPNVYVPTAFTPNRDGMNDGFHPVSVAVKDYHLMVFNRWGQKVFETMDQAAAWDGTFAEVESPAGIYMYVLSFTDFQNKSFVKKGTVQLIR